MTTNPYAEAVEAAYQEVTEMGKHRPAIITGSAEDGWRFSCPCGAQDLPEHTAHLVEVAVAAAVGPLLAPVRALVESARERGHYTMVPGQGEYHPCISAATLDRALDAIEAGATSEGGQS